MGKALAPEARPSPHLEIPWPYPLASPKAPGEEPPPLNVFGLRRGTVPTYSPYVQERWELVEYVNSTVLDDVAQPVWRESSAAGDLADVYGLSRLSTSGGSENLAIADTYLEDGLGSVSAVLREGGAVAASLSYSPWGEEELSTESLPGYGDRFERPHYGYNAELTSPEGGLQYLRARWYDPSMGAFGSRDSLLGDAADPATLNRYAYAEGNPVASCDPTGHVTAYKNRLSSQRATQRRVQASGSRRTTSAKKTSVFAKVSAAVARFAGPLVKAPPLKKMTKELSRATNRTFKRVPARIDSVVVAESGTSLRYAGYYGSGKGGGSPGGFSSGTARTVALTASAIRARNYAAAARAAFCGTAAHMGESKTQGVDLAAIGHGALDLLGFIPGIGAAADVANGLWYAAEGNYVDAAMSFVSAIPGFGDSVAAANTARKIGTSAVGLASSISRADKISLSKKLANQVKKPEGGAHRDVVRSGREAHHTPADSVSPLERPEGPTISMEKEDHRKTASWGPGENSKRYREKQRQLIEDGRFRDAVQMDVDDIRSKFGEKYDDAIGEMLEYVDELSRSGKI